ncbi:unnamed protein product [Closterium sp. Naga37s-1]|nr:unnamed protein product [Closterium sp. Naga37s-1]
MAPVQPSVGPSRDEPRVFGLDKFNGDNFAEWSFRMENVFDHYDLLEVMEGTEKRPENDPEKSPWLSFKRISAAVSWRVRMALGQRASAVDMVEEEAEDKGEEGLVAATSAEAPGVAVTAATTRATDAVAADSTASVTIATRADTCGATATNSLMVGPLLKAKRVEEQEEGEDEAVEAVAVAGGGAANMKSGDNDKDPSDDRYPGLFYFVEQEVKGMGKAMFKGADGKMVGLKNVLWVPSLAANLISVRRLAKAGMDTNSKGAKTYTARLGDRILWDLHEDRDVYNEMWQIPVVPMPKERQVAASISTKDGAVGSDDGANGRAKENELKKSKPGGTSKFSEPKESGAATKEQQKGEENPEAAAEEDYGESMWGAVASAAFSNPTSATGECDWLTLHRRMGHVALPILQQLVKNEMVAGIRVKGEPDEVLGCPTCIQAKFTRFPFPSSEATAKAPLDEVVMDVVGPLKLGAAGAEYFLTIVRRLHPHDLGRKPKVDMLRVFGCMCMALVPKHLRHNKLGAKAVDCKFMENFMYKDWEAENEAKIGVRFGEVKSSGLEHVELPLELSSGSTTTRQSSLVNGGEEANDAEEEEEEVQQVSERAPSLPSRTTSAPRIRATPQQRQGLQVPAAEEEGRGKMRVQPPNRLTYDAPGKQGKTALAGVAMMVGDDEESDYEECAFAFFSPVEMPGEPATLKEALESSDAEEWKKAMESELKSIEENDTFELVELPEGRTAITSKWLFKIKSDADGKIERYKSRLVAKGYQQKEKVDFKELFAPVVKPTTLRTLFAGAAIKGWAVKQMDIVTAFLNGILEEEIFMAQPEGFDDGSGRVWKLKKALYGLKQAPRQWYMKLREVLEGIGFTPSTADHSLFMLGEGEQRSFIVVYVDDILIFSPSPDLVKEVMLKLQDKFKCKSLGDVNFYLGLHIERDVEKRSMRVHQRKYLEALAANFGQSEGHVATPFPSGFKCVKGPEEESVGEEERRRFHSLVGQPHGAIALAKNPVLHGLTKHMRVKWHWTRSMVTAGEVELRYVKTTGQPADMMTKRLVEQQHWKCCKLAGMALN